MSASKFVTSVHIQHALLLLVRQQGGTPAVAHAAAEELQRWRAANDTHEHAYQTALRAWHGIDANELQAHVALPPGQAQHKRQAVRRALVTVLGLAGLAITSRWSSRATGTSNIITTAQAQIRTVRLNDGTRVDIGARTTLRMIETDHVRQVFLASGDTRFSVTKDPLRPFIVTTTFGRVTVIGTEFSVSVTPASMSVAVVEGMVGVRADKRAMLRGVSDGASPDRSMTGDTIRLAPGDAVDVNENGLGTVAHVAPTAVGAWRDGWLIFDREALLTAVARWNSYTQDTIRVRERDRDALHGLHITGSFSFADEAAFLISLPKILPVRVTHQGGYAWIEHR
jgi:transmembrane sensor